MMNSEAPKQSEFGGKLAMIQGSPYLRAHSAIEWFREDFPIPFGGIRTQLISEKPIIWRAEIFVGDVLVGVAHAVENSKNSDFGKLETNAVRRALAYCGYGTEAAVGDDDTDAETGQPIPRQQASNGNGRRVTTGTDAGDLRDKEVAGRFIAHWRDQGLSDADTLAALGVDKLSLWTQGRKAADEAVGAWVVKRNEAAQREKQALDGLKDTGRELGAVVRNEVREPRSNALPDGYARHRLTGLSVIARQDGGHQYILACEGPEKQDVTIVLYSADVFRQAGFTDARIDGWKQAKKLNLPADQYVYLVARQTANGKGNAQWDVARVDVLTREEHDQCVFEALATA